MQACTTTGPAGNQCQGTQTCSGDQWGSCEPGPACSVCAEGDTKSCYDGPAGTQGVGICQAGTQTCSGGQWGACQGEVLPGALLCNGQDNNCDGIIDDEQDCQCSTDLNNYSAVNAASGNLSHSQDLFSVKSTGPLTGMTLYYRSLNNYSGPVGKKWTHTYNINLVKIYDGSIILNEGDGKGRFYTKTASGYAPQAGDYSTLLKNADGTYVITEKNGLRYNFDQNGKVTSVVDRNGNTMTFSYAGGNLSTVIDPSGRIITFSYDASNRIIGIVDPAGAAYALAYANSMLTSVTNPDGGRWSYTYDNGGFMLTKTDPNNSVTSYTYDNNGREISAISPDGQTKTMTYTPGSKTSQMTETDGGVWTYNYDTHLGVVLQKTDPQGNIVSYTYDQNKNMLSQTAPDGSTTSYSYDANGNMISMTDALGQTTSYTYNSFGQVTSVTDPQGNITSYTYDAKGNLISTTDPTGATTSSQYNAKGNITSVINATGQTTFFTYDQNNNIASITDPTGATMRFTYDAIGNMTSQTDANGNTTTFAYDSQNHLIKVTDPSGNVTTYAFDKTGNRISQTDANGNTTNYAYNYKGQVIKVIDALGDVTTYAYGGTGCPSCGGGADKLTSITDANGNTTAYTYDTLGRLARETDPLGNTITYSYDVKGNLTSRTDANGNKISYAYDAVGRLLTKLYPDGTAESFSYDAKGNIVTAANQFISYTFSRDAAGRVTTVTDSQGHKTSYTYDPSGRKTQLFYPDGSVVNYSYDRAGRLKALVDGANTFAYQYDNMGKRTMLTYPNGATANYAYDSSGRLMSLIHKDSNSSIIGSYSYTLDNVGNRLTKTTVDTTYAYSYDAIYRLTQALSSAPGYSGNTSGKGQGIPNATQQQKEFYIYDPVGNRLSSDKHSSYAYNQANQLLSNGGNYMFDKDGNLIFKVDGTTSFTYFYDYENRLTKVVKNENGAITTSAFNYDPLGRRIEKDVTEAGTTTTTKYVYDNYAIILEYDANGNAGNRYVQGLGIDEHLAIINGKDIYYYHADGLGSVIVLTDNAGNTVQTYQYDSFGNLKDQMNRIKQPYTFTGREWDKEAGLYYYRARYYDAQSGRFITRDPIGFKGGINLYAAMGMNPILNRDPLGLKMISGMDCQEINRELQPVVSSGDPYKTTDAGNSWKCTHLVIEDSATCICTYEKNTTQEQFYARYIAYKVTYKCGCKYIIQNETERVEDEIQYAYVPTGITINLQGTTAGAFDTCSCGSVGDIRTDL
ncbi:MAG: DUF6531 domain-containing protein [Nitrospiraceae bacterium]|nr:DUF6531 domain-containing protein [Nitrospiraceae bacterium]